MTDIKVGDRITVNLHDVELEVVHINWDGTIEAAAPPDNPEHDGPRVDFIPASLCTKK